MSEEEIKKYLSAMRVIDYKKEGFLCGKETLTEALELLEKKNKIIAEICANKKGIYYILKTTCIDKKDEDIILYENKEELIEKIEKIMNEIHMKEEKENEI